MKLRMNPVKVHPVDTKHLCSFSWWNDPFHLN
jgi:hypothetical protein